MMLKMQKEYFEEVSSSWALQNLLATTTTKQYAFLVQVLIRIGVLKTKFY